ncbi:AtMMH-1 [Heliocybe sulcata]|uniref:AtMMH-1 n=1 Tax=Heliocybe sulcata TaxID=5364 RepID=A0A5C3NIQ4_9AGAM|nr:AtMMH-1 [Heliocybe sulcata]
MPELPLEVEETARMVRTTALGKSIQSVETAEDAIVFSDVTHEEFAKEITGRKVVNVGRYGKVFYIELDGAGRVPVLHLGMTGAVQVKGVPPIFYKEGKRKASTEWPPKFMKFVLHLSDETDTVAQLAFLDPRRLGRIRLCASPMNDPPISTLGFDPILSMPSLDEFTPMVIKRKCPIKALLLDQTFSAGIGNWVADEVLYHARIHPEQRCATLMPDQLFELHKQIQLVCQTAVEAHADDSKFPENWLFKHRWGKGKKEKHTLKLPSGEPATIRWITVGGRTSAYVVELQKLTPRLKGDDAQEDDEPADSDLTPLSDEATIIATVGKKRKAKPSSSRTRGSKRRAKAS